MMLRGYGVRGNTMWLRCFVLILPLSLQKRVGRKFHCEFAGTKGVDQQERH